MEPSPFDLIVSSGSSGAAFEPGPQVPEGLRAQVPIVSGRDGQGHLPAHHDQSEETWALPEA